MSTSSCGCAHSKTIVYCQFTNCLFCGALLSKDPTCYTMQDPSFAKQADVPASQLFVNMLNDQYLTRHYNPSAAFLTRRPVLVELILELGNKLKLATSTMHIAVRYMDSVLCNKEFPKCKYPLIALTALILAAKYDELDMNIPSIIELRRYASSKVLMASVEEYKECEGMMLKMLNWSLRVITPLIFVELLLTQGVLHSSDKVNGETPCERDSEELTTKSFWLCDSLLKYYKVQQYAPSVIAAGVVLSARKLLGIEPHKMKAKLLQTQKKDKVKNDL